MSLREMLADFAGQIAVATSDAPDEYPEWSDGYEAHMADIKGLWAAIRPQLKRDLEQAEFIDGKLLEMFAAFDAGEKDKGQKAAWMLYNAEVSKLQ